MKILIATDGSEFSEAAIDEARRMVIRTGDEILVVSGYEDAYPMAAEPFAISTEFYQKMDDAMSEMANSSVSSATERIRTDFPADTVSIETEVFRGSPDRNIVDKAKEWNADLIVVGSHGRGFWGRLLGSVSNGVVHHAPCNVLVVRKAKAKH